MKVLLDENELYCSKRLLKCTFLVQRYFVSTQIILYLTENLVTGPAVVGHHLRVVWGPYIPITVVYTWSTPLAQRNSPCIPAFCPLYTSSRPRLNLLRKISSIRTKTSLLNETYDGAIWNKHIDSFKTGNPQSLHYGVLSSLFLDHTVYILSHEHLSMSP